MSSKIYSVHTQEDLRSFSTKGRGPRVFGELDHQEILRSASYWNTRHLIAYRLITDPKEYSILPILQPKHLSCAICTNDLASSETLRSTVTQSLLEKNPKDLSSKSDSELLNLQNGEFWVNLARAIRSENSPREHPQRNRKPVERIGFENSTTSIVGSSSPTRPSSSEYEVEIEENAIDSDQHDERRNKPEEVTVALIISFLQTVLLRCLVQSLNNRYLYTEIRPRIERRKATLRLQTNIEIRAEDDGGICRMRRPGGFWTMNHAYMALLEAKRCFKDILCDEDGNTELLVVPNEYLAQYFGEAVIVWGSHQELLGQNLFTIAAVGTFVRLIHFRFGSDYGEYLAAKSVKDQRRIVEDESKDAAVYMSVTKWSSLESPEGRKQIFCLILLLLRWWDVEQSHDDSDEGSDDDSMGLDEEGSIIN